MSTFSITLKIAVDAPMPRARVTTATIAKPGLLASVRKARRMSCQSVSMLGLPQEPAFITGLNLYDHRRGSVSSLSWTPTTSDELDRLKHAQSSTIIV